MLSMESAGKGKVYFQKSTPCFQLADPHSGSGMFVREDPVFLGIPFIDEILNGFLLPWIRAVFLEHNMEFFFKGSLNGFHGFFCGNLAACFMAYCGHALTETVVALVLEFYDRRVHDVGHQCHIEVHQKTGMKKERVVGFGGGG